MKNKSLRTLLSEILTNRFFIVETIIITSFTIVLFGGVGFLFGLIISLATLWAGNFNWSYFGLGKVRWIEALKRSFIYTLLIIFIIDVLLSPIIELYLFTDIDLSTFESLEGNVAVLIQYLLLVWILIAFGEEFFFRGYIMKRIAKLLVNLRYPWLISAILSSLIFGVAHSYQGSAGMITSGLIGLILAYSFYKNQQNLLVGILSHGLYDTYGLLMIFYGERSTIQRNYSRAN